MNPLGKLPESTAITGKIDWVGFLKIIRMALLAGAAGVLTYLLSAITGFHLVENETINSLIFVGFFTPLLEALRRAVVDYSAR